MAERSLTALLNTGFARCVQRRLTPTAGSAASGVSLAGVAGCSPEEALQRLGSSADGLTTVEAAARLGSVGLNEVAHEARHTILGEMILADVRLISAKDLSSTSRTGEAMPPAPP